MLLLSYIASITLLAAGITAHTPPSDERDYKDIVKNRQISRADVIQRMDASKTRPKRAIVSQGAQPHARWSAAYYSDDTNLKTYQDVTLQQCIDYCDNSASCTNANYAGNFSPPYCRLTTGSIASDVLNSQAYWVLYVKGTCANSQWVKDAGNVRTCQDVMM